jgi:hypothetical protein
MAKPLVPAGLAALLFEHARFDVDQSADCDTAVGCMSRVSNDAVVSSRKT